MYHTYTSRILDIESKKAKDDFYECVRCEKHLSICGSYYCLNCFNKNVDIERMLNELIGDLQTSMFIILQDILQRNKWFINGSVKRHYGKSWLISWMIKKLDISESEKSELISIYRDYKFVLGEPVTKDHFNDIFGLVLFQMLKLRIEGDKILESRQYRFTDIEIR